MVYPLAAGFPHASAVNQVILGDNLNVMTALRSEYAGRINLIYTDPPFFTNRHFHARVGRGEDSRRPKDWHLAKGYTDDWPNLDAYLDMLYARLKSMYHLLAPNGTLYLHLDWHANSYARLLLDEIFGSERLLNEIVWVYHGPSPIRSAFNRKHDTILVYTKGDSYTFNTDDVRLPYDPTTIKTFASSARAGFGKVPDLERGKVPEDWWYFPVVARLHNERTGYPTQKPQALLERIIRASSNPGDIVADFFSGSGTTAAAACLLDRQFIVVDGAWRAVQTTISRLVGQTRQPFRFFIEASDVLPPESLVGLSQDEHPFLAGGRVSLPPNLLDQLDYWEAGCLAGDGIFYSAAQATRPYRQAARAPKGLPASLDISPILEKTNPTNVTVRLVAIDGRRWMIIL